MQDKVKTSESQCAALEKELANLNVSPSLGAENQRNTEEKVAELENTLKTRRRLEAEAKKEISEL